MARWVNANTDPTWQELLRKSAGQRVITFIPQDEEPRNPESRTDEHAEDDSGE